MKKINKQNKNETKSNEIIKMKLKTKKEEKIVMPTGRQPE